ncbi:serine hydrolase [Parabacteroides sp. FAFU027]|uniref:serine hydrolase n=1 Tax=Parabacteroides sp. FAFU027 TaxID=2922715 RepID=UPI001FAFD233|nr:serine hydrolase [Parabacteroides sp. FAFU027]
MKRLYTISSFLLMNICSFAQIHSSQQIDSLIEKTREAFNVPGIAVAVIKDGKIIHSKGYGVRSLNTMNPVDENTLFGIASNTKAFTATALGILVDEGKIQWDDKVIKYIPEFKLYDAWVTKEFTIRDLLTHRSGLGMSAGDLIYYPDSSDFAIKDIIYGLRFRKPASSFRSKFEYNNSMYIVAGEVVARVSGKSWEDFIEERIFRPIEMTQSAASFNRIKNKSNVIDAHALVNNTVQVIPRHYGTTYHAAGGIYSSIADLSKWGMLQLAHGKYGDSLHNQLFSDNVHEEMWSPQTIMQVQNPVFYNTHFKAYGLGFVITDVQGYKQILHRGFVEGMKSQITMLPELNLGIIVLTNQQEGGAFEAITNQILDGYFNIHGRDWINTCLNSKKQSLESAKNITDSVARITAQTQTSDNRNIKPYTGIYHDPWFGDVVISMNNGKYWFKSKRSPLLTGEIFPYKDYTFIVKWRTRSLDADAFITFSEIHKGKPIKMTIKSISPLADFSCDFQDLDFTRISQ